MECIATGTGTKVRDREEWRSEYMTLYGEFSFIKWRKKRSQTHPTSLGLVRRRPPQFYNYNAIK